MNIWKPVFLGPVKACVTAADVSHPCREPVLARDEAVMLSLLACSGVIKIKFRQGIKFHVAFPASLKRNYASILKYLLYEKSIRHYENAYLFHLSQNMCLR